MPVKKRNGLWQIDFSYKDPVTGSRKRFRRSTPSGTSKRDAQAREAEWRLECQKPPQPEEPASQRAKFGTFAVHWDRMHVQVNMKPTAQRSARKHIRLYLLPKFDGRWLRLISTEQVEEFKAELLSSNLAPKTVKNTLGTLSRLFSDAVRWGYAEKNPCSGVTVKDTAPRGHKFWEPSESDAFLTDMEANDPHYFAPMAVALLAGLRAGEICGLDWPQLDLAGARINVTQSYSENRLTTPKSGHSRTVPIPTRLVEILQGHPRHLRTPVVFPPPGDTGERTKPNQLWHALRRALDRTGLPRLRFHDLRHTYGSQLAMASVPLGAIQHCLGHSDARMTQRYAHLGPDSLASFVEVLSRPAGASPDRETG